MPQRVFDVGGPDQRVIEDWRIEHDLPRLDPIFVSGRFPARRINRVAFINWPYGNAVIIVGGDVSPRHGCVGGWNIQRRNRLIIPRLRDIGSEGSVCFPRLTIADVNSSTGVKTPMVLS